MFSNGLRPPLAEAEDEELDEPRDEVAGAGDGVLARPLHGHVAPARGEEGGGAPVQLAELPDDDEKEEELEDVGQQAGWGMVQKKGSSFCLIIKAGN